MNVQSFILRSIDNATPSLTETGFMHQYVTKLLESIDAVNYNMPNIRESLVRYIASIPVGDPVATPVEMTNISKSNPESIVLLSILYALSDINKFDLKIMNYALNFGLQWPDIIVILFINDLGTLHEFCNSRSLQENQKAEITTLKKLSALHKITYNFR